MGLIGRDACIGIGSVSNKLNDVSALTLKPRHMHAIDLDLTAEHVPGAHPERAITDLRAVQDQRFERFAVPHHAQDIVERAFVVAVGAGGDGG